VLNAILWIAKVEVPENGVEAPCLRKISRATWTQKEGSRVPVARSGASRRRT